MLRGIARESTVGFVGLIASLGSGFVTKALLANFLSANEFGVLLTGQAIVGMALLISQLALPEALVRFVGLDSIQNPLKVRGRVSGAVRVACVTGCVVAFGIILAARWFAVTIYKETALTWVLIALAMAIPFTTVSDCLAAAYRGLGQLWVKVLCIDVARAFWVVPVLAALTRWGGALDRPETLVAAVFTLGAILSTVLAGCMFLFGRFAHLERSRVSIVEILAYSTPLFASGLLTGQIAGSTLPLILGSFATPEAVAYFGIAVSLQQFVYMPTLLVEQASIPAWSGKAAAHDLGVLHHSYSQTTRWSYMLASIAFVALFVNARMILSSVYGPTYEAAAPAVQLVAAFTLFNAATGPNEGLLRAMGSTRGIFLARVVASVVSLAGAFWLIPRWGLIGAAGALVLAGTITNGLYGVELLRKYRIHPFDVYYVKTIVASGVAFVAVLAIDRFLGHGIQRFALSAFTYGTLLLTLVLASHAIPTRDIGILKGAAWMILRRIGGSETGGG